ncbi:PREDICTED: C-C motif chemokine 3-like [Ficedula albicollis]|uniref:Chemokine interleukin-8-like domain-containing protein n=1 Tax=Ficedula albicollis TaxID=59894 RepID=U3K521_FICAL|nr:PREDICTED: C-C motif chemokine 3-like [Ficedula albicollis]
MRVLAASLAVLLLVAICSQAEADHRVSGNAALFKKETKPTSCCFSYISRPIPRGMINSAYRSSSSCSLQAVILVTKKGREVCADPKAPWVQKYLEDLELLEY